MIVNITHNFKEAVIERNPVSFIQTVKFPIGEIHFVDGHTNPSKKVIRDQVMIQ